MIGPATQRKRHKAARGPDLSATLGSLMLRRRCSAAWPHSWVRQADKTALRWDGVLRADLSDFARTELKYLWLAGLVLAWVGCAR